METQFTTEQMHAVAIILNHVEGRFIIEPEDLRTAINNAGDLWEQMLMASKKAERNWK